MPSPAKQFGLVQPFVLSGTSQSSPPATWSRWPWPVPRAAFSDQDDYPDISVLPSSGILEPYFGARGNSNYPATGGILQNLPSRFLQQSHPLAHDSGLLGPALTKITNVVPADQLSLNSSLLSEPDSNAEKDDNRLYPPAAITDGPEVSQSASDSINPFQSTPKPQPPNFVASESASNPLDAPAPSLATPSTNDFSVGAQDSPNVTSSQNSAESGSSFSGARDRAQSLISSDPELSAAVALAERAGDKSFHDRLTSLIANLELDPNAARDALWREVFASGLRSSGLSSLANAAADWAVQQAAVRLDKLRPNLGMGWAHNSARNALNELNRDQHQTLYQISNAPVGPQQKWELMGENGLIDSALASSPLGDLHRLLPLLGGGALAGGAPPFGPGRPRVPRRTASGESEDQTKDLLDTAERIRQIGLVNGIRYMPGEASGIGGRIEGRWLFENPEALVPTQVADLLRGAKFSDFDEYRRAFWRSVVRTPELASQFSSQNRALMAKGQPPKAPQSEHSPWGDMYHLHHVKRISDNGDVYNADNIRIVTPKRHYEIHNVRSQ